MAGKRYIHTIKENIGGDTSGASIRFNSKWQFSNDGSVYNDFGTAAGDPNSVLILPTYEDLPSPGATGRIAILENTETGIPYLDDSSWKPYCKGIIGTLFPAVSTFSSFGSATKTRSQGFLKMQCSNSTVLQGLVRTITTPANITVGTITQQHFTPVTTGTSFAIFSGVCFRESNSGKIYSVMVGVKNGKPRLVRVQKWTDNATVSSTVDYTMPSLGSDLCVVKLNKNGTTIRSWYENDVFFSGTYLEAFTQSAFFDSSPDQFGFCSYSEGTSNTAYFINYQVV